MDKANIFTKIDLKRTLLGVPIGETQWLPIEGFTVNTARSTAARLTREGEYGRFSIKEDYNNHMILIEHK